MHSPALCVSAPGGAAFRASPKPQPFPGPLPAARHAPHPGGAGTQKREQPPPGCLAGRCPSVARHRHASSRALPSLHCRAAGSRGRGTWEGEASHPLDPRSGSLVRTRAPCISSCICQPPDPIETCSFWAGNSGSTGLKGDKSPRPMKKMAEKYMKAPLGGRKQHGTDACLKPGSVLLYTTHREAKAKAKACQGPVKDTTANHHAVITRGVDTKTPAHNTSGLAPGRDLIILSANNGLWHTCTV